MSDGAQQSASLNATRLLDAVERAIHHSRSEWFFLRELRVGTGHRNHSSQRLDAFALNCLPHLAMKRVCYEIKTSRADFLGEMKQPLKRRIGMRYSNEFYFVTPGGLLRVGEIPVECGLIEVGTASFAEWTVMSRKQTDFFNFDSASGTYCIITVAAPWRDTPGPTWGLVAAMLRNQRREMEEKPPKPPAQARLVFE